MMRLRQIVFAATSAFALGGVAAAQPVSLEQAVRAALGHDPSTAEGQALVDQAQSGLDAARAKRGLQVGAMAKAGSAYTDFTNDTVTQTPLQAGVEASWTLYASGRMQAEVDRTSHQKSAAEFGAQALKEQVMLDTIRAYADLWLSQETVAVRTSKVDTLQLRLEETQARHDQGLVTQTDVSLAEARLAGADAEMEAARAAQSASNARLERLSGFSSPEVSALNVDALLLPPTIEAARQSALANSAQLAQAKAAQRAAKAGAKEARAEFGPRVSLSARAGAAREAYFFFEEDITDAGAFVNFEMPLFTNGLKGAAVRGAVAGQARADAVARRAELGVNEAVSALWGDISARRLALVAAKRGETAADIVAEGARREHDGGLRTLVDALDAEDERRLAQIRRLDAERNLFVSIARLLLLTGDIEDQVLN